MRNTRKSIAVFGSSAPLPGEPLYELARSLGRALADAAFDLVNGGHEGAMEAAAIGARERGGHVVGVTCRAVRAERGARVNAHVSEVVDTDTLFERIEIMMRRAAGFLVLPGGTGTLAELAIVWEHVDKGYVSRKPLVCLGQFWRPVVEAVAASQPRAAESVIWAESVQQAVEVFRTDA